MICKGEGSANALTCQPHSQYLTISLVLPVHPEPALLTSLCPWIHWCGPGTGPRMGVTAGHMELRDLCAAGARATQSA